MSVDQTPVLRAGGLAVYAPGVKFVNCEVGVLLPPATIAREVLSSARTDRRNDNLSWLLEEHIVSHTFVANCRYLPASFTSDWTG